MTQTIAPEVLYKRANAVRNVLVDMSGVLDEGETLTGTPTLTVSPVSQLTATSPAVTTEARTIGDRRGSKGGAVTFTASAGEVGTTYPVTINCATSGSQSGDLGGVRIVVE